MFAHQNNYSVSGLFNEHMITTVGINIHDN